MSILREIHDELNERFAMREIASEEEVTAELKSACEARGLHIAEIIWTDGSWGRIANIRLEAEADKITVSIVGRRP